MSALRSSLCLTLVCIWIAAASNVQAQQPEYIDGSNDAANEPSASAPVQSTTTASDPRPTALPPPPPKPEGAEGQWQWKGRTANKDRESLLVQGRILFGQIEDLREERSRYGLAGPIILTSIGASAALVALSVAAEPDCDGCSNDGESGTAVLGIGGLAMAIVGVVMLSNRLGPRRELGNQIKAKEKQLRSIEERLQFSTLLGPNHLRGASLALSF